MKLDLRIGDKVRFHSGFWGGEQGARDKVWWYKEVKGTIIKIKRHQCLIELKDGSREWVELSRIIQET